MYICHGVVILIFFTCAALWHSNFGLGLVVGGGWTLRRPIRIYSSTYIVLLSIHKSYSHSAARDKQRIPFWGEIEGGGGFTAGTLVEQPSKGC